MNWFRPRRLPGDCGGYLLQTAALLEIVLMVIWFRLWRFRLDCIGGLTYAMVVNFRLLSVWAVKFRLWC
jgi:hypothetical protein